MDVPMHAMMLALKKIVQDIWMVPEVETRGLSWEVERSIIISLGRLEGTATSFTDRLIAHFVHHYPLRLLCLRSSQVLTVTSQHPQ